MKIGVTQIALAGFCFGFLGIFGKLAFAHEIPISELLPLRFAMAAIILCIAIGLKAPVLLKISRRELLICAGLGILGYAVFSTLYFTAIRGVSVAVASLLLYTFPVLVSLGAHFVFKEHLTKAQWIALPITAVGLLVLLGGGSEISIQSPLAVAAGLGSAVCYAIYILASSRLQKDIHPLTSALYVIIFAALGLAVAHQPNLAHVASYDWKQWSIIIGIAVVCTVAPLFLFLSGLQKLGNTQASLLSTIEPVTAAVMGILILHENPSLQVIGGGALVLMGLAVSVGWTKNQRA